MAPEAFGAVQCYRLPTVFSVPYKDPMCSYRHTYVGGANVYAINHPVPLPAQPATPPGTLLTPTPVAGLPS